MSKTMDDIVLSVVIPCYNEKNTIETVLDAVHSCGVKNLEVIVVDDCYTDGTGEGGCTVQRIPGSYRRCGSHPGCRSRI